RRHAAPAPRRTGADQAAHQGRAAARRAEERPDLQRRAGARPGRRRPEGPKASDVFFHVCAEVAAKEQSTRKLAQTYGTLIELYYDAKQYANCARVCREVLDL